MDRLPMFNVRLRPSLLRFSVLLRAFPHVRRTLVVDQVQSMRNDKPYRHEVRSDR